MTEYEISYSELSPVYGTYQAAPQLRMYSDVQLPVRNANVIQPLFRTSDQPGRLSVLAGSQFDQSASGYCYEEGELQHYIIFGCGRPWALDVWESDAEFIYCQMRNGKPTHFVVCDGTSVSRNDVLIFTSRRNVERFEWLHRDERESIFTTDEDISVSVVENLDRSTKAIS